MTDNCNGEKNLDVIGLPHAADRENDIGKNASYSQLSVSHSTNTYLRKLNRLSFNVFDQTAIELLNLMQDAYLRFVRTNEYDQFVTNLGKIEKSKHKNKHKNKRKRKIKKRDSIVNIANKSNIDNNKHDGDDNSNNDEDDDTVEELPRIRNATSYETIVKVHMNTKVDK